MILEGKNIVLGVTGGIAAYKAVDVCSKLVQSGANVDVILTEAATHFIPPLPFQTLSKNPVSLDAFQLLREMDMAHIELSKKADALLIAPLTANTLAKLALGLADNLLTSTALACTAPLVLAPAMDADMWAHPATQANLALLVKRGARIVGPGEGRLASGRMGRGRLVPTAEILGAVRLALGANGALAGKRVLVTAGGTQEALDPVRHLGNRSPGKMGYALAQTALDAGAAVALVHAPTCLDAPYGAEDIPVRTASDMLNAVLARQETTDVLVMAAAVADYRPAQIAENKIKKTDGELLLELERTADILATVGERRMSVGGPAVVVGFAAETQDLLANARTKMERKRVDLMVANDVSATDAGFGVDTNRVTLLASDGSQSTLPLMSKVDVADHIIARIVELLEV